MEKKKPNRKRGKESQERKQKLPHEQNRPKIQNKGDTHTHTHTSPQERGRKFFKL